MTIQSGQPIGPTHCLKVHLVALRTVDDDAMEILLVPDKSAPPGKDRLMIPSDFVGAGEDAGGVVSRILIHEFGIQASDLALTADTFAHLAGPIFDRHSGPVPIVHFVFRVSVPVVVPGPKRATWYPMGWPAFETTGVEAYILSLVRLLKGRQSPANWSTTRATDGPSQRKLPRAASPSRSWGAFEP